MIQLEIEAQPPMPTLPLHVIWLLLPGVLDMDIHSNISFCCTLLSTNHCSQIR